MAVQVSKIYTKARTLTNTNSTTYPDATLLVDTNETYLEICRTLAQNKIEVTGIIAKTDLVVGQSDYALPADCLQVVRLEINYIDTTDYTQWRKMTEADLANLPETWTVFVQQNILQFPVFDGFGDEFRIAPQPTTGQGQPLGLRLWYISKAADFAASTDFMPHPFSLYWDVFAFGDAWKYYESRNPDEATRKYTVFTDKLQKMVDDLKPETTEPIKSRSQPQQFNNGWL